MSKASAYLRLIVELQEQGLITGPSHIVAPEMVEEPQKFLDDGDATP